MYVIWRVQSMIPHYASFIIDYIVIIAIIVAIIIIIGVNGALSLHSRVANSISIELERSLLKFIWRVGYKARRRTP